MSKLFKLSGFVSVNEAQDHVIEAIGESVSFAEIYQLVLNGDLVVSARLDVNELAMLGQYIPFSPQEFAELSQNNLVPEEWAWIDIEQIGFDRNLNKYYAFNSSIIPITGCWDFTMLGSETRVIDHYYRIQATKTIDGGLYGLDLKIPRAEILLRNGNQLARLQSKNQSEEYITFDYFLNKLVIKKSELRRFVKFLVDDEVEAQSLENKDLSGKERNTLLSLIGALLKEQGINPSDRGITPAIRLMTETAGVAISENTIRKVLGQVNDITA